MKFKPNFNFTATEENGRERLEKIKIAHFNDCIFKLQTGEQALKIRFPDVEFGANSLQPEKFVINSRKVIYLRWQEILVALLKTF